MAHSWCSLWAATAWISSLLTIGVRGGLGRGPGHYQLSLKSAVESETGVSDWRRWHSDLAATAHNSNHWKIPVEVLRQGFIAF